jgi:hypothetical protein
MTPQEKDLERLRAWDRYKEAQRSFLAHKAKVQHLEKPLGLLHHRLRFELYQVVESDFDGIPTREEFAARLAELRSARLELERARKEAQQWGFPLDENDLMYSPVT